MTRHDQYSPGYGTEIVGAFQTRTFGVEAAFFAGHLRSGMDVLDCGAGPGTITAGLADVVAPGVVIGIDSEPRQVQIAMAHSRSLGRTNAHFQVGSVYQLPFPDERFDAVFANGLLQHLDRPLQAVMEMRRVLKPGGIIGIRDDDHDSLILGPATQRMERVVALLKAIIRHSGGDPCRAREHRQLLHIAGFHDVVGSASVESDGTLEATTRRGDLGAALLAQMQDVAVREGWASAAEMRGLIEESRAWGRRADAFDAITWCEATGRKP